MSKSNDVLENNARISARGDYTRWLLRRYDALDIFEFEDDPPPVSLRDIFVPIYLSDEDTDDEKMDQETPLHEERAIGQNAWDCIVEHPFLALSGRPGSGKTTPIKALIIELCGQCLSRLRERLVSNQGILLIPLILRELPEIEAVETLDQLVAAWLEREADEAAHKDHPLDKLRLQQSINPDGDNIPLLYLFDGLDELGSNALREKVLLFAAEAVRRGHRASQWLSGARFQQIPCPCRRHRNQDYRTDYNNLIPRLSSRRPGAWTLEGGSYRLKFH
ncbi:MAG: hypothetical protein JMN27_18135 [gamma proteobacterium endosymbiont of Lamellibrachia anaximandri]|nr:hypothetical protein [gamma proteobacterium endosymbiont of Lamellibrachia anaximandri]MBL3535725.1 hypothetical protein [gamma proteobacterium endosymbiont of Lamellibrachia anaximandri]